MSRRTFTRWYLSPLAALLYGGALAAQGPTATIRGQMTDSSAQRPLTGAEVYVVPEGATTATQRARVGATGQYTITGVPAGTMSVRVRFVGYLPKERTITLRDGEASQQQKFIGSGAVPLPIASWNEAQLILAEAVGGQAGIDAINRVRAANGVTTPLVADPASDITALVIEERRRQLFSEGHRLNDMLRKNIPSITGVNRKGQTFGTVTCVPLPDVETQNNPNFKT
jgi:hypothetical protein